MTSHGPSYVVAEDLLKRYGLNTPPVDVDKLAMMMGAAVVRTRAEGDESGFVMRDGSKVVIGVNSGTSRRRQRFTVAHEIGHLLMHEGNLIVDSSIRANYRNDVSSMATDAQEMEANKFAAALLMPMERVREAVARLSVGATSREDLINRLSREFDVSTEATGYRLINLGIASA